MSLVPNPSLVLLHILLCENRYIRTVVRILYVDHLTHYGYGMEKITHHKLMQKTKSNHNCPVKPLEDSFIEFQCDQPYVIGKAFIPPVRGEHNVLPIGTEFCTGIRDLSQGQMIIRIRYRIIQPQVAVPKRRAGKIGVINYEFAIGTYCRVIMIYGIICQLPCDVPRYIR